jgi:hypothetical protein
VIGVMVIDCLGISCFLAFVTKIEMLYIHYIPSTLLPEATLYSSLIYFIRMVAHA